jgi:hypothetical protein
VSEEMEGATLQLQTTFESAELLSGCIYSSLRIPQTSPCIAALILPPPPLSPFCNPLNALSPPHRLQSSSGDHRRED